MGQRINNFHEYSIEHLCKHRKMNFFTPTLFHWSFHEGLQGPSNCYLCGLKLSEKIMKMQHNYVLDSLSSKKNITTPPPHTTLYIVMYMHIAQVKWRELNERVPIDLSMFVGSSIRDYWDIYIFNKFYLFKYIQILNTKCFWCFFGVFFRFSKKCLFLFLGVVVFIAWKTKLWFLSGF